MYGSEPGFLVASEALPDTFARAMAPVRLRSALWSMYAVLGMFVALAGVANLVSYLVSVRSFEVGVRIVLGALPSDVAWILSRETVGFAFAGLIAGAIASRLSARAFEGILGAGGVPNWITILAVGLILLLAVILGALYPVVRILRQPASNLIRS